MFAKTWNVSEQSVNRLHTKIDTSHAILRCSYSLLGVMGINPCNPLHSTIILMLSRTLASGDPYHEVGRCSEVPVIITRFMQNVCAKMRAPASLIPHVLIAIFIVALLHSMRCINFPNYRLMIFRLWFSDQCLLLVTRVSLQVFSIIYKV
jgi:hypothetical protein